MTVIWSVNLSSPDVHFIDPIKMLEVGAEHEDGKEVDAQFWIVHVSERSRTRSEICKILLQNNCMFLVN